MHVYVCLLCNVDMSHETRRLESKGIYRVLSGGVPRPKVMDEHSEGVMKDS